MSFRKTPCVRGVRGYLSPMTATAAHVLEQIKTLPPPEMQAVWEQLTQMVHRVGAAAPPQAEAPAFDRTTAQAALEALDGKFTGSRMHQLLLEDRAQDRHPGGFLNQTPAKPLNGAGALGEGIRVGGDTRFVGGEEGMAAKERKKRKEERGSADYGVREG